ncbi:MAG: Maltodextrin transporter, permease protein MdxF [Chloroflexi bacterium]|jgi:ABC-type sugar transport system permease subunit|nr:Maltodextrin transporter, permease protein MdxF [Chloroflexota bacterium]
MQQTQSENREINRPSSGGSGEGKPKPPRQPLSLTDLGLRVAGLAFVDGIAIWFALTLINNNNPIPAILILLVTAVINYIFLSNRLYPIRWLTPGLVLLLLMVIYPIGYNVYISLTNYSRGNALSREQVVTQLKEQTYQPANAITYSWTAYRSPDGQNYKVILVSADKSKAFIGDASGLKPTAIPATLPDTLDGYTRLTPFQAAAAGEALAKYNLKSGDLAIQFTSSTEAKEILSKYSYDAASGNLTDLETSTVYRPVRGTFTAPDGKTLTPGFVDVVGIENYTKAFTDPSITGPFIGVFIWTFIFAALTVFLTFWVGLLMALVLNDAQLPLRTMWRVILFIPYTIPGFITALIWAGLFSIGGPVGISSKSLFGEGFSWFADPNAAKTMLLFINLWLGYPYMMLICLGALQSIPTDMYEAATIDGASQFQKFWGLTLPLLLVSVGPLLIGSFAFNFNNFTIVQLVTAGGPANPTTTTPAGQTDILISYTYRLAFTSGDLAFAAAISLFIFAIIATITAFSFRFTKQLEEVLT